MAFFSRQRKEKQKQSAWLGQKWVSSDERAVRHLDAELSSSEGSKETAEEVVVLDEGLKRKKMEEEEAQAETEKAIEETAEPARKNLRVLLVTSETGVFRAGSTAETEYAELAGSLDELHIIVITLRDDASYKPRRIAQNVWLYPTNSRSPLFALYDAYRIARKQMAFAAGFRADLIIATDAFAAGTAAYAIAKRHDRPLQLQISVDPFEKEYTSEDAGNKWRMLAARFVAPRADCIVARSKRLQTVLKERYPDVKERITLLPPFYNLSSFRDAAPVFDLHERYPQFKFVILVISRLDARGLAHLAIEVCTPFLRQYHTVGLVIVGDGPLRAQLEKQVVGAQLQNRIIFETDTNDLVSYMKSANLLLNVAADEEHDAILAAAAAAGLPVLTVASNMASTLFEDGVSASVCPEHDVVCLQARIGEFLNDNHLRSLFTINARNQVFSLMEQDVAAYREQVIDTFESCVLDTYTKEA